MMRPGDLTVSGSHARQIIDRELTALLGTFPSGDALADYHDEYPDLGEQLDPVLRWLANAGPRPSLEALAPEISAFVERVRRGFREIESDPERHHLHRWWRET